MSIDPVVAEEFRNFCAATGRSISKSGAIALREFMSSNQQKESDHESSTT